MTILFTLTSFSLTAIEGLPFVVNYKFEILWKKSGVRQTINNLSILFFFCIFVVVVVLLENIFYKNVEPEISGILLNLVRIATVGRKVFSEHIFECEK